MAKKNSEKSKKESKKPVNSEMNKTIEPDKIPDDTLMNLDYTKIEPDERGLRVLMEVTLACSSDPIGVYSMTIPIRNDEEAIKNKAVLSVKVPFLFQFPIAFIDTEKMNEFRRLGISILPIGNVAFGIEIETEHALSDIFEMTGDENDRIDTFKMAGDDNDGEYSYNEQTGEYVFDDKIYHENDVIWQPIVEDAEVLTDVVANLNTDPTFTPCDVSRIKNLTFEKSKRKLTEKETFEIKYYGLNKDFFEKLTTPERVWYLASEYAKDKDESGNCVVCLDGHFYVPVESFLNVNALETDNLIVFFNTAPCLPCHHACVCTMLADVGSMQMITGVKYSKGLMVDWNKRFEQEVYKMRLRIPDYDPYDDPYDNMSVTLT